jgi:hypothetical protein
LTPPASALEEVIYFQPYRDMRKFPHMQRLESAIWRAWMSNHGAVFEGVAYDVRCGKLVTEEEEPDPVYRKVRNDLWRKRIDVVTYSPGHLWLIEIKSRLTILGPAQCKAYEGLFRQSYQPTERLTLACLYTHLQVDAAEVAATLGILTFQVPAALRNAFAPAAHRRP